MKQIIKFKDIETEATMEFSERHSACTKQFTGLYDKNGKEIYHKDKLKTHSSGRVLNVCYQRGAYGYILGEDKDDRFVSFAENFANLKGKGNQLNAVEVVE